MADVVTVSDVGAYAYLGLFALVYAPFAALLVSRTKQALYPHIGQPRRVVWGKLVLLFVFAVLPALIHIRLVDSCLAGYVSLSMLWSLACGAWLGMAWNAW